MSNRKYTITLGELHFTSDLSDSNQPGTFKLTNHSWKFNAPSFLLTFPVQSGCCNEKSPVCGLSCFPLTVGGTGRESCKCSSILPRRFLQDSSLDFSLQNQVGRSRLQMIIIKLCCGLERASSYAPLCSGRVTFVFYIIRHF